jgi:DNA-binding LacI/PurR family transcriptional regulator
MTHTDRLAGVMRKVLERLPGSVNALAKRAGVSQSLLWHILDGSRNVTPVVAEKVAAALESWGAEATAAAKALRRALHTQRGTR